MKRSLQLAFTFGLMLSVSVSALLYFFYGMEQLQFKSEARQEIRVADRLQTIKVPVEEFDQKNTDEVWVGGRLYDVNSYVIIDDTAFITVLHDEQEESLVKNIVESFEPNDKCTSDNTTHVTRHRIRLPDGGKILVAPYTITFLCTAPVDHPTPCSSEQSSRTSSGVIKPPPKQVG